MSIWWFALLAVMAPPYEVVTRSQGVVSGQLVELSAEKLVVDAQGKRQTLAVADLLELRPQQLGNAPEPKATVVVRLIDGSQLDATDYRVEQGKATVVLAGGTKLALSTRKIDYVRLQTSPGAVGASFDEITRGERNGDTIVVVKGETLDFVSGTSGDVTDETVYFEVDGDKVPVKRPKVEGVLYFHPVVDEQRTALAQLELLSGGKLAVVSAQVGESAFAVVTPAGAELAIPWSLVRRLQFKGSYLSDLEPESFVFTRTQLLGFAEPLRPHDLAFHRPRFNEPFEAGQPLRLGGVPLSRSLALYAGSEISFRLGESYRQLQMTVGIDDSVRPHGQLELKILSEHGELKTVTLSGREPPQTLELPLADVRRVRIVVRSLASGIHDRVLLGEPRLVK